MGGLPDGVKISTGGAEDILEVYAEWCAARDMHMDEGDFQVPIPVADMYITRLLLAFKKIPKIVIEIPIGKH